MVDLINPIREDEFEAMAEAEDSESKRVEEEGLKAFEEGEKELEERRQKFYRDWGRKEKLRKDKLVKRKIK